MRSTILRIPEIHIVPGGHWEPAHRHKRKRWMSANYHKRIQKKWLKRWGEQWIETLKRGQVLMDSQRGIVFCRLEDAGQVRIQLYGEPGYGSL